MDLYTFCLALGFIGLLLMSVLGALGGHGGHAAHGADTHGFHLHGHHEVSLHGHATHHHGDVAATSHASAHGSGHGHAQSHAQSHAAHHAPSPGARVLSYLSPRVLFAIALGFGATGLLTAPYLSASPQLLAALAGGIGLEKLIISPLWNGLMRFGSNPARTLESALLEEATAVTAFDQNGFGLVSIDLDGHEMRVLARIQGETNGQRVRVGDKLIVEEVDAARGQCRVSRVDI